MGFQKKTGKGRLDKYYHLAKEQGYRARSAYKLIQLNRDFNFLSNAKCLIDLCAAPGGWLQVSQKYMPVSSLIVGVDLVPIKPIPNVITMVEDITTDKCRNSLHQTLKTWKADVVLHDGAPNVGSSWTHDAFTQSELVLKSFKLATEFLRKGGTFVTKVFRSKDYNSLIWVFNQFFGKVKATKPVSSRNVSAEIFVVCLDYSAPKHIDPRFLDAKFVFEDLDLTKPSTSLDIFAPESKQKKRHREGYEDGKNILYSKASAMEFIRTKDPVTLLGSVNELVFEDDEAKELLLLPETTEDIIIFCRDTKVLGKRDFKMMMKWRQALRERYKLEKSVEEDKQGDEDGEQKEGAEEAEENVEDMLDRMVQEEKLRQRKQRRRLNEKRQKQLVKMQLNMTTPKDIGMDQGGDGLFTTNVKPGRTQIPKPEADYAGHDEVDVDDLDESMTEYETQGEENNEDDSDLDDDERRLRELDRELNEGYEQFLDRMRERDAKLDIKRKREEEGEFKGFSDDDDDDSASSTGDGQGSGADSESESSDEAAIQTMKLRAKQKKKAQKLGLTLDDDENGDSGKVVAGKGVPAKLSKKAAMWFDQPLFKNVASDSEDSDDEEGKHSVSTTAKLISKRKRGDDSDDDDDNDDDGFETVPAGPEGNEFDSDREADTRGPDYSMATVEAMTLAYKLANREVTKHTLQDDYFNRYALNDTEGLPDWFVEDERKHNKPNLPITKEVAQLLREKLKALNARPIKKIAEAKARKKLRANKRLASLTKKAEGIAQNEEMTEADKSRAIERMMSRANKSKPKNKVQVVVAKGANRKIKGRPKGIKGRYKMVDRRMKKDLRAQKAHEAKSKNKRRRK